MGSTFLLGDLVHRLAGVFFSCVSILTANLAGVIQGDWRDAGKAAVWHLVLAICLLLTAVALLVASFFIKSKAAWVFASACDLHAHAEASASRARRFFMKH